MTDHVDLNRAYLLLRAMSHGAESVARVAELIDAQEHPDRLVRGLGAVINELVEFVDEAYHMAAAEDAADAEETSRDHLHSFQPAIVTRLHRTADLDPASVPLMAGVLTAASLGLDCYEWRRRLGPPGDTEYPVWAFTAFYLCDLIGHAGGDADYALDMIGSAVADADRP
jgi:hypothetical protein